MKDFLNKGIPMPKIIFGTRGSGKAQSAQKELEKFQSEHPDEKVFVATSNNITQKKLGATKQSVPAANNYNDAIKLLIASGKAKEILNSDKGKLLSAETFTPTGELSPEWSKFLKDIKEKENET